MNTHCFVLIWLAGVAGCGTPGMHGDTKRPTPRALSITAASTAPAAADEPQVILFGDGQQALLHSDGSYTPLTATDPAISRSTDRLADAYVAHHHRDWGPCVFNLPAADGYHCTYVGPPPATGGTTRPADTASFYLWPGPQHELVVRSNKTVAEVRP